MLSLRETAEFLGLSMSTVHRLIREGELPAIRIGKRMWKFRRADLDAYLEDRRKETARRFSAVVTKRRKRKVKR